MGISAVTSIHGLQHPTTAPAAGDVVMVTDPDRGGHFVYEPGLTHGFDDGIVFELLSLPSGGAPSGGFRRLFDGPVRASWYGMVPDDITWDPDTPISPFDRDQLFSNDHGPLLRKIVNAVGGLPPSQRKLFIDSGDYLVRASNYVKRHSLQEPCDPTVDDGVYLPFEELGGGPPMGSHTPVFAIPFRLDIADLIGDAVPYAFSARIPVRSDQPDPMLAPDGDISFAIHADTGGGVPESVPMARRSTGLTMGDGSVFGPIQNIPDHWRGIKFRNSELDPRPALTRTVAYWIVIYARYTSLSTGTVSLRVDPNPPPGSSEGPLKQWDTTSGGWIDASHDSAPVYGLYELSICDDSPTAITSGPDAGKEHYLGGIELPSHFDLQLHPNTRLFVRATDRADYELIRIGTRAHNSKTGELDTSRWNRARSVRIRGGQFIGERNSYTNCRADTGVQRSHYSKPRPGGGGGLALFIAGWNCEELTVEQCRFDGSWTEAIWIGTREKSRKKLYGISENITVRDCLFIRNARLGVTFNGVSGGKIHDNVFLYNGHYDAVPAALDIEGGALMNNNKITITNNRIESCGQSGEKTAAIVSLHGPVIFSNNEIINNDGFGLHVEHASRCIISNNKIMDNQYQGIGLDGAGARPCFENIISGNLIRNNGGHGIVIRNEFTEQGQYPSAPPGPLDHVSSTLRGYHLYAQSFVMDANMSDPVDTNIPATPIYGLIRFVKLYLSHADDNASSNNLYIKICEEDKANPGHPDIDAPINPPGGLSTDDVVGWNNLSLAIDPDGIPVRPEWVTFELYQNLILEPGRRYWIMLYAPHTIQWHTTPVDPTSQPLSRGISINGLPGSWAWSRVINQTALFTVSSSSVERNVIEGNLITDNAGCGVLMTGGWHNTIQNNRITRNGAGRIDTAVSVDNGSILEGDDQCGIRLHRVWRDGTSNHQPRYPYSYPPIYGNVIANNVIEDHRFGINVKGDTLDPADGTSPERKWTSISRTRITRNTIVGGQDGIQVNNMVDGTSILNNDLSDQRRFGIMIRDLNNVDSPAERTTKLLNNVIIRGSIHTPGDPPEKTVLIRNSADIQPSTDGGIDDADDGNYGSNY